MIKDHKIITLCGSTKFREDFERVNKELTLAGNIVISVGAFIHSGDNVTDEQKVALDEVHRRKIDLADAIYVINKDGYIDNSTKSEIEYAEAQGKEIMYMEKQTPDDVEEMASILCSGNCEKEDYTSPKGRCRVKKCWSEEALSKAWELYENGFGSNVRAVASYRDREALYKKCETNLDADFFNDTFTAEDLGKAVLKLLGEDGPESAFKAKEGEITCDTCRLYNRCAMLNGGEKNIRGCRACKSYEVRA